MLRAAANAGIKGNTKFAVIELIIKSKLKTIVWLSNSITRRLPINNPISADSHNNKNIKLNIPTLSPP